jgi:hypothetical protein
MKSTHDLSPAVEPRPLSPVAAAGGAARAAIEALIALLAIGVIADAVRHAVERLNP